MSARAPKPESPYITAAEVGRLCNRSSSTIRRRILKGLYGDDFFFDGYGYQISRTAHEAFQANCRKFAPVPVSVEIRKRAGGDDFSRAVRRYRDQVCGVRRGAR